MKISPLFCQGRDKPIIGMVHCAPLMGTVGYEGDMRKVIREAVSDAKKLEQGGIDAILIENHSDRPVGQFLSFEQTCAFAALIQAVSMEISIPFGVAASFCDYKSAIAIAAATGASFIRCPVFTDTVVTSCGVIGPCAFDLMRYRKQLCAENVAILADVQVKYSHPVCSNISLEESAVSAAMGGADAVIITGSRTGGKTPTDEVQRVKKCVEIPVLIGSGFCEETVDEQLAIADGVIVGSACKEGGIVTNPVSQERTASLMKKVNCRRVDKL